MSTLVCSPKRQELIEASGTVDFTDITGVEGLDQKEKQGAKSTSAAKATASAKGSVGPKDTSLEIRSEGLIEASHADERETESSYARILMRTLNVTGVIDELQSILRLVGVRTLFVFIDDFSELPETAMHIFVDAILAPLNNWSNELIKFKVAAYPGRIYYGKLDPLKMDEIYLGSGPIKPFERAAVL